MWHQIEENKKRSSVLIFTMLCLLIVLGACVGLFASSILYPPTANSLETLSPKEIAVLQDAMLHGIFYSIILWIIMLIVAFLSGKNAILALNHAKKIPTGANRILENVVEEMSIAAGLPKRPDIYIIDCPMPNAFATGMTPKNSAIAVTTGLLTTLDRDELQAVVAHEIAHIVNRDTMYMLFAGIMLGTIMLIADSVGRGFLRAGCRRSSGCSRSNGGGAQIIIIIIALLAMIIAPIAARIFYYSLSKKREFLADACAVQFTRYPQGLATALAKISGSIYVFRDADRLTSAMYIVHPLDTEIIYKNRYSIFGDLFSTHPPTEKRIEVLQKMVGADFNAYNQAFRKVGRKTIMKKEELYGVKPLAIKKPHEGKQSKADGSLVSEAVVIAAVGTLADTIQKEKEEKKEILERKRDAVDTVWKANNYIFKQCDCGTKLKFPQEYKGQEFACPHCGKVISVEEDTEKTLQ